MYMLFHFVIAKPNKMGYDIHIYLLFCVCAGDEPRALTTIGRCCATALHPKPVLHCGFSKEVEIIQLEVENVPPPKSTLL